MSRNYTVIQGDSYDLIARKLYGDDQKAGLIQKANPGTTEPLVAGTSVTIPTDPSAPTTARRSGAVNDPDETAVSIDGSRFRFWSQIEITRSIDSVDSVAFVAPFEPDEQAFRDAFRPFSYPDADVSVGGVPLFTGTLMSPSPTTSPNTRIVTAGCYSRPGVMADCSCPASAFPLEWNNVTLRTIATDLAAMFGLSVVFTAPAGDVFERVAVTPQENPLTVLAKLASQRNLVIGTTEAGALLFQQAVTSGRTVANFTEGQSPQITVGVSFSPQEYYSSVTGISPTIIGLPGVQYTVKNGRLSGVIRPFTFDSPDTEDSALAASVQSKIGRMFAGAVEYNISVDTWRDPSGALWSPNTLVSLFAPGVMVYGRSTLLVKSVILRRDEKTKSATLICTLPGALAGEVPETLPWEDGQP